MKKIKLKSLKMGANEVLTRSQLKNVLGGAGDGSGGGIMYCGTPGIVTNCPINTTSAGCGMETSTGTGVYEGYCKDSHGNCYAYGTASCTKH